MTPRPRKSDLKRGCDNEFPRVTIKAATSGQPWPEVAALIVTLGNSLSHPRFKSDFRGRGVIILGLTLLTNFCRPAALAVGMSYAASRLSNQRIDRRSGTRGRLKTRCAARL